MNPQQITRRDKLGSQAAERKTLMFEIEVGYHFMADTLVIDQLSLWERANGKVQVKCWRCRRPAPNLEHSTFQSSSKAVAKAVFEALRSRAQQ
jgi:hypothetical protein